MDGDELAYGRPLECLFITVNIYGSKSRPDRLPQSADVHGSLPCVWVQPISLSHGLSSFALGKCVPSICGIKHGFAGLPCDRCRTYTQGQLHYGDSFCASVEKMSQGGTSAQKGKSTLARNSARRGDKEHSMHRNSKCVIKQVRK